MKLKQVLKGHLTDKCVVITRCNESVSWSGKGIQHITNKYAHEWLDQQVSNVTKDRAGRTWITLANEN